MHTRVVTEDVNVEILSLSIEEQNGYNQNVSQCILRGNLLHCN